MISVDLKGLKKFEQKLKQYKGRKRVAIENQTTKSLMAIERNAKRRAPVNKKTGAGGRLRSSIHRRQQGLDGDVRTNVHYAPYQEFGTGNLVSVPDELQEIASQFRGKGVRQVNLPAQPFLYPSLVEERPKYVKGIEKALGHEEI